MRRRGHLVFRQGSLAPRLALRPRLECRQPAESQDARTDINNFLRACGLLLSSLSYNEMHYLVQARRF
jgi:hypothetical protein